LNNYGCVKADGKEFWLRQRNNLIAHKEDADGKSTPKILQSGLTAAARTNEIRIDPFGQVLKSSGESQLPFVLGNISMLAIVPLSPEGKDTWEVKSDCVIRESAPAKPVNPKIKKKTPPPQATTVDYPAQEISTFTLGKKNGDIIVINKKYILKTRQEENGKAHLEFQGEGSINFDAKLGVPRSMEFKGTEGREPQQRGADHRELQAPRRRRAGEGAQDSDAAGEGSGGQEGRQGHRTGAGGEREDRVDAG